MSSSKTASLKLNQWQRTDPVVMDDFNADNAKVDAALSSLPVVKLFSVTVGTAAQQVDIDLSGVDWSRYAYLHVCADLPGTSSSDLSGIVRINGLYDTNYKNNGSTSAFNYIESFNSSANVLASQMQMDVSLNNSRAIISGTNYYINTNFSALITGSSYYGTYASSLSAITALNFIVYGGQIAAGAKIDVYGYRR